MNKLLTDRPGDVPAINPPRITAASLLLLRHVKVFDPYRGPTGGVLLKGRREAQLKRLEKRGLIRKTREGFWKVTGLGVRTLLLHSNRNLNRE